MKELISVVISLVIGVACYASDCQDQMVKSGTKAVQECLALEDHGVISGKEDSANSPTAISLEPYMLINWTGINGKSDIGSGFNAVFGLSPNLSIVGFAEANDSKDVLVERFGAGLRYTAYLNQRLSLDGGVAGAYDLERDHVFLRLPLGGNFYIVKKNNFDLGARLQYAFDISGSGKRGQGTADGSAFLGLVLNVRIP